MKNTTACCGVVAETTYCPQCGKRLVKQTTLADIRDHCRNYTEVVTKRVRRTEGYLENDGKETMGDALTTRHMMSLARDRVTLSKWEEWSTAMAEAVATEAREK